MKKINFNYPVITLGSPYGVGYEIFLLSLDKEIFNDHCPVCIGSEYALNIFFKLLGLNKNYKSFVKEDIGSIKNTDADADGLDFVLINVDNPEYKIESLEDITDRIDGYYALASIELASELVKNRMLGSVVTLPVSKKNINIFNPSFSGHTEFFRDKWDEKEVFMTFVSKRLCMILLTTHVPLKEVAEMITSDLVKQGLKIAKDLKDRLSLEKKICFLGLNPHAGEGGLLGKEELWIKDIIVKFNRENNTDIDGPIPSDTAFLDYSLKRYGIYIANFHDQGLIPFKIFSFEDGVNLSFGMKYIRTSVDHGTAVNLIGKKVVSLDSFLNAYSLAIRLSN